MNELNIHKNNDDHIDAAAGKNYRLRRFEIAINSIWRLYMCQAVNLKNAPKFITLK
jgi:hypothetical protein